MNKKELILKTIIDSYIENPNILPCYRILCSDCTMRSLCSSLKLSTLDTNTKLYEEARSQYYDIIFYKQLENMLENK